MKKKHEKNEIPINQNDTIIELVFDTYKASAIEEALIDDPSQQQEIESLLQAKKAVDALEMREMDGDVHEQIMNRIYQENMLVDMGGESMKKPQTEKKMPKVFGGGTFHRITKKIGELVNQNAHDEGPRWAEGVAGIAVLVVVISALFVSADRIWKTPETYLIENANVAAGSMASEPTLADGSGEPAQRADMARGMIQEKNIPTATMADREELADNVIDPWKNYPFTTQSSIRHYDITLHVEAIDPLYNMLIAFGETQSMSRFSSTTSSKKAIENMKIRLYTTNWEASNILFLLENHSMDNLFKVDQWDENVSLEVEALRVEISAREIQYARLLDMSEKVASIEEFVYVENVISDILRDINSNKARLNLLAKEVNHSTVDISTQTLPETIPIEVEDKISLSSRMKNAYNNTWNVLIGSAEVILLWLASYIMPLALLGMLIIILILLRNRRISKQQREWRQLLERDTEVADKEVDKRDKNKTNTPS